MLRSEWELTFAWVNKYPNGQVSNWFWYEEVQMNPYLI